MNLTLSDTAYTHIGNLLKQHDKKYVRLQVKVVVVQVLNMSGHLKMKQKKMIIS